LQILLDIVHSTFHVPSRKSFCLLGRLNWVRPAGIDSGLLTIYFLCGGVVSPTPNPQPGGSGIYNPQRQGCPVIPPGTGYPFWSPLTTRMSYGGAILFPDHHTGIIRHLPPFNSMLLVRVIERESLNKLRTNIQTRQEFYITDVLLVSIVGYWALNTRNHLTYEKARSLATECILLSDDLKLFLQTYED
jgi:hypothetical protein